MVIGMIMIYGLPSWSVLLMVFTEILATNIPRNTSNTVASTYTNNGMVLHSSNMVKAS